MSRSVRIVCQFEVEVDDDAVSAPSQNVDELRSKGERIRAALAPVRDLIEAKPDLRLVSWSTIAASVDGGE